MIARLLLLAAMLVSASAAANEFHPPVPLLDSDGALVMESAADLDVMTTCGGCHDTQFIRQSSDHMNADVFEADAMECLVCHSEFTAPESWDPALFEADGSLQPGAMDLHKPRDHNCATCHQVVNNSLDVPLTVPRDADRLTMTDRTGQIISPQKIANSGLNIAGKNELTHPFDVHADRVVGCVNCHYSLNNPVYYQQNSDEKPPHLAFDPRRLSNSEYLERPLHQLAKGSSREGLGAFESENSMRRCESCHEATAVHQWLPYKKRHFDSLACESCHVPKLYGPAVQAVDAALVDPEGRPFRRYRDVEGDPSTADSLIHGFRPLMMARNNVGGERKLAPYNLVTHWQWLAGEPGEVVEAEQLARALYQSNGLHPDLVPHFDTNGDGEVSESEFRLETPAQVEAVRQRLAATGLQNIRLDGEIHPYAISHNVVNGRWATRDCRNCHGADSVLAAPFLLAEYLPGGLLPEFVDHAGMDSDAGQIQAKAGGGATFTPSTTAEGYYVLGLNNVEWVDLAGLAMFLGISLGVSGHGFLRYLANRRRPRPEFPTKRIQLYDAYERIWHWLQAGAILMLLFTGLVIHKPHFFGMFSFRYVVQVHNVLGFILLINAALALFYTLASGTIRRFFPDRDGFFRRTFEQAMFYSRGIFAGEGHPLQKTRQNRLNPLQQVTYLAILNILLPAQVITGVLIWGMQEWPQLAAALGGLPVLAPIHTFLAWAFAAFIVMHVYLTTTGETPLSGIKSMVTGWEDVEMHEKPSHNHSKEASHD
jgi:thiosulfate reductase cytochrome b subunit